MQSDDFVHEILTSIKEVVSDMKGDIREIKTDINDIKVDVAHHILRTDLLQDEQKEQKKIIAQLQKDSWKLKGALALIGLLLTVIGTYGLFKHG